MGLYQISFLPTGEAASISSYQPPFPPIATNGLCFVTDDPALGEADPRTLRATVTNGEVSDITFVEPPESPLSLEYQLLELKEITAKNIMASEHDKKWLTQKETLKVLAISWIKANPTATQAEFQTAVFAALALEFPSDPIVINPEGIIVSYAVVAKNRNLIAEPTFVALRDLIVATSEKNLNKLLAKL